VFFERLVKHGFRLIDLHTDLGQVGDLQRCTVLVDQGFDIKAIELEISILNVEAFLGKIECLLYQVGVSVIAQCQFWSLGINKWVCDCQK
jgi:hypothetical protein